MVALLGVIDCRIPDPRTWAGSRSTLIEAFLGVASGVSLPGTLGDRSSARCSVNGDGGPAFSVFIAEVDEHGLRVVLHAEAVT